MTERQIAYAKAKGRMSRKRPKEHLKFRMPELMRLYRYRGHGRTELELLAAINADIDADPTTLTARELGELVQLTLEERVTLGIRTIAACDKPPEEIKAFYAARRRERDRNRSRIRRLKRTQQRKATSMIKTKAGLQRAKVRVVLRSKHAEDPTHWSTVGEIAESVVSSKAFAGLKPNSLHRTINHVVDNLSADIESDIVVGKRGFPTRLIRWKHVVGLRTHHILEEGTPLHEDKTA
jgi:stress-induced morphogen